MKELTLTPSGRPAAHARDKWQVLNQLRLVAPAFGLKPREVATLQALISFINPEDGRFMVFASNETLRLRLMNISDRTIQRHVLRLEEAGLLRRRLSANRRRFSLDSANSYGFDLEPLYRRSDEIEAMADAAAEEDRQSRALRHRILARLRDALIAGNGAVAELSDRTRLALRRARSLAELARIDRAIAAALPESGPCDKLTEPARQNDGAIQDTNQDNESVIAESMVAPGPDGPAADPEQGPDLQVALDACPAVKETFGTEPRNWQEAASTGRVLASYLGIAPGVAQRAMSELGPRRFAVSTFLILQRYAMIRNPSGYLAGMLRKASEGSLNLTRQCRYLGQSHAHP